MNMGKWIDDWRDAHGEVGFDAYLRIEQDHRLVGYKPHRRPPGLSDAAWDKARMKAAEA
jgi:hypothetical protein